MSAAKVKEVFQYRSFSISPVVLVPPMEDDPIYV
jgi:hypothetical protein